jgi:Protein of unknown function (DUF1761)
MIFGVHWYLVVLGALAYFAVGALWYSPVMFSKSWMAELHKKPDMSQAGPSMVVTALTMLVLVAVEAYFYHSTGVATPLRGGYLGAKLWFGFAATTALINNVFQQSSKKLYAIDQGYHLVGMVLAGLILAL